MAEAIRRSIEEPVANHANNDSDYEMRDIANAAQDSKTSSQGPTFSSITNQTHATSDAPNIPPLTVPAAAALRKNSETIGPASDLPTPILHRETSPFDQGPSIRFTLLLASTGTRHVYQITERYLAKRGVSAVGPDGTFDPAALKIYTLKELISKDWRDDWDTKPSSPSAIRLISFGQLLNDNATLKECKIHADGAPNVLHVTVKPRDAVEEDEAAKAKASISEDHDLGRGRGCCCVIL